MKTELIFLGFAAVLGLYCAGFVYADEITEIDVGQTHNISIWGSMNNLTFRVTEAVANQTVTVRVLRRKGFFYTTSHMYLCPQDQNCSNTSLWSYEYDSNGTAILFTLIREPHTYDTEVPVTIKVCNESCAAECPNDCDGSGGCDAHYHTCFCDAGHTLKEGSCVGEEMTSGRIALIVCMTLLAAIIILVIVGLLFHFCEKKAPKPKSS